MAKDIFLFVINAKVLEGVRLIYMVVQMNLLEFVQFVEGIGMDLLKRMFKIEIKEWKKLVGQVTVEEKNEIQALFERRNGLNELSKILTVENKALYEKLVKDLGETGTKFQNWWNRMGEKYNWESVEGGNWEIDFDTCNIYLVTE